MRQLLPVYYVDYVVDLARPGASGLSDVVWDMAEELVRQGGAAHVFGPYSASARPESGVAFHRFRIPPPGYRNMLGHAAMVLSALYEIRRMRQRGIIHAPEYFSTAILSCVSGFPVVLTVPGNVHERLHRGVRAFDPWFTAALRAASRVSAWRCARVVATSRDMELWWAWTGVTPGRLVRIPYGMRTRLFNRTPDARRRIGIDDAATMVLHVGRLNMENGQRDLLRAFAAAAGDDEHVTLHVVGSGPDEAELKALAGQLGIASRVQWHGWIDSTQLPLYYSATDLFVFSAHSAGMPRVVFEAMACGAPVLATRVPGVEDHVTNGVNGYLVQPADSDSLCARLLEALRDPDRQEKGARGQAYVQQQLSWSSITRRLIDEVYRPLSEAT